MVTVDVMNYDLAPCSQRQTMSFCSLKYFTVWYYFTRGLGYALFLLAAILANEK